MDRKQLVYANVQTVVAANDLEDYYLDVNGQAQYLRLDFDSKSLGVPFSHPLVHVHVEGELSPRFALDGGDSGNIIVDYLDFLYRNYAPMKWLKWAEREWNRELASAIEKRRVVPFSTIADAFSTNQLDFLRDHAGLLNRFKRCIRRRKDEFFRFHMDASDRELLEYPLAR